MGTTLATTLSILATYGYYIILPISIVEGPIIAPLSGVLVSLGTLNWFWVFVVLLLGDTIGDLIWYIAGHRGGNWFIARWGTHFGITEQRIEHFKRLFAKHDSKILLLGKAHITGLPVGIALLFSAGVTRMHFGRYMLWNTIGSIPKIAILEALGYYLGNGFVQSGGTLFNFAGVLSFVVVVVLVVVTYVMMQRVHALGKAEGLDAVA
jgi:membrane protein DedA with SNARE-associated domain